MNSPVLNAPRCASPSAKPRDDVHDTARAIGDGPFAWQDKRVLRQIRERIEDYGTALAVYAALSIVASDNSTEQFETTHQWLAQLTGFSVATVRRRLADLERIGAVQIVTPKFKAPCKFTLLTFAHGELTPFAHGALTHGNAKSCSNHERHQKKQETRNKTETETGDFAGSSPSSSKNASASKRIPFTVSEVFEFALRNRLDDATTLRFIRFNNLHGWPLSNWRGSLLKFGECCDETNGADAVPEDWTPEIVIPEHHEHHLVTKAI
jgi:hypothetical protein